MANISALDLPKQVELLANKLPVDDRFIAVISQNISIDAQLLLAFKERRVEIFYAEAICGGRLYRVAQMVSQLIWKSR